MKRVSYKTRKVIKWVIIGVILGILTLITLLAWFLALVLTGGMPTTTKDMDDYDIIYENRLQSGLIVFPEEITEEVTAGEFSYFYQDTLFDPTVSIFLQATYTSDAYEAEVERLENTRKVYGGTVRTFLKDEGERYPYPAYIAIDNHHSQYEYALLSGENQITYIYTAYVGEDKVEFPKEYLPTDYREEQEDTFYGGYSIYIKLIDSDMGLIDYDNSREEFVTVTDGHTKMVESSYFTVRVQLDEQNREIITECEFSYYEPPADLNNVFTYDEESDDTIFTDLNGFEYRNLRLSEDRKWAIVTYVDDAGVEQEWQVELTQYMKSKK